MQQLKRILAFTIIIIIKKKGIYSMKTNFVKNWNLINVFAFSFLFLATPSQAVGEEQEKVKYFDRLNCDIFKYDSNCKFVEEVDSSILPNAWGYYEARYSEGRLINAARIAVHEMNLYEKEVIPTVADKLEFDSKGRITRSEVFLHDPSPEDYRLCKTTYGEQTATTFCHDKNGGIKSRTDSIYKDNLLVKSSWYDESLKLKSYTIYNHKTEAINTFSPDHIQTDETDMMSFRH